MKWHRVSVPASPRRKRATPVASVFWRRIRARKLAACPWCEYRYEGCRHVAAEVDHVDGDSANNAPRNLKSACKPCHSRKTVRHDGGFGREVDRMVG